MRKALVFHGTPATQTLLSSTSTLMAILTMYTSIMRRVLRVDGIFSFVTEVSTLSQVTNIL